MRTSPCRGKTCRAQVVWAWTGKKPIPINPAPHPDGNVRLHTIDEGPVERYHAEVFGPLEVELAKAAGVELHMPHHATCPDAEDF